MNKARFIVVICVLVVSFGKAVKGQQLAVNAAAYCNAVKIFGVLKYFDSPIHRQYKDSLPELFRLLCHKEAQTFLNGHLKTAISSDNQIDSLILALRLDVDSSLLHLLNSYTQNKSSKFAHSTRSGLYFRNEVALPSFDVLDPVQRLYNTAVLWNHFFYLHPFVDRIKWQSLLQPFVTDILAADSIDTFHQVMIKYLRHLTDHHASYINPYVYEKLYNAYHRPAVRIRKIDGSFYIVHTTIPNGGKYIGGQILEIDNKPVKYREEQLLQWLPTSGRRSDNYSNMLLLGGYFNDTLLLKVKNIDGEIGLWEVRCDTPTLIALPPKPPKVAEGIFYYNPATATSQRELNRAMKQLKRSDYNGCIIDLRGHPDFYIPSRYMKYFFKRKVVSREYKISDEKTPGEFLSLEAGYRKIFPWRSRFKGPVIVLINEYTYSASELLAIELISCGAISVGTNSMGATGQIAGYVQPDGTRIIYTHSGFLFPSGEIVFSTGITPNYPIITNCDDILTGNDPQFNYAVELINRKITK